MNSKSQLVSHKRLCSDFSISELKKAEPLYNFGVLDKLARYHALHKKYLKYYQAEDDETKNNNCADKSSVDSLESRQDLLLNFMKNTYGQELFENTKYTCKGRVGIPSLPTKQVNTNSMFQSCRARIVTPVPFGTFGEEENCFEWIDGNNSNADIARLCARRAGSKIAVKKDLPNWIFLYFRVRKVSWEFVVYEEKMNSSAIDLFSETVLDRWTNKIRFKMIKDAPMKFPLMAFLSRMGLDNDPDIVFCIDGFFGDMLVGGSKNKNNMPYKQVSFNTTPEALSLQNGDNIFVVKTNSTLRNNVETHMHMLRSRQDSDEEEDDEYEDESDRPMSSISTAESQTDQQS